MPKMRAVSRELSNPFFVFHFVCRHALTDWRLLPSPLNSGTSRATSKLRGQRGAVRNQPANDGRRLQKKGKNDDEDQLSLMVGGLPADFTSRIGLGESPGITGLGTSLWSIM